MRTFSCFTFDEQSSIPTLSFIFAPNERRARALARQEMLDTERAVCVEVFERDRLLWTERA